MHFIKSALKTGLIIQKWDVTNVNLKKIKIAKNFYLFLINIDKNEGGISACHMGES